MQRQYVNILGALSERRQGDDLKAQPVEQIGAKPPARHQTGQILVGGAHQPHIDTDRLVRSQAGQLAIFHHSEQAFLCL